MLQQAGPSDRAGVDFDAPGHLSEAVFDTAGVTREADVYLCGPDRFMADMKGELAALGVVPERIHIEIFNGGGTVISFARSGIAAHWNASKYQSILEAAEACDVPVRWSCRTGVCHNCESGLVSGTVSYEPEPLEEPAGGNLLVCRSQPTSDLVLDL